MARLNLTRAQIAAFAPDFETIKQFERLFAAVDDLTANPLDAIAIGNAGAQAGQALDQIAAVEDAQGLEPPVIEDRAPTFDYVDFAPLSPHVDIARRLRWNPSDQTLEVGMEMGVTQQIGLEAYLRVLNDTGVTIANGSAVGFGGVDGSDVKAVPYLADGSFSSLSILGIMTHDIADGETGYCTVFGKVRGLDTSAWSVGTGLYASPDTPGALTSTKPTAPDIAIPIAVVLKSDATEGEINVRPTIEQQKYYGQFVKTSDVSPAAIDTAYAIVFDSAGFANGVALGTPASRVVATNSGLYNFAATLQISSGNTSEKNIWVWFRKNGTDIADSASLVTVRINGGYTTMARSEVISLGAGEYVEMMWAANNVNVTLESVVATAFAPASPAVILNVSQVQQ